VRVGAGQRWPFGSYCADCGRIAATIGGKLRYRKVRCVACPRTVIIIETRTAHVCSDECNRERRNMSRRVKHDEVECADRFCKERFVPRRSDHVHCSDACRVNDWRRKRAEARRIRRAYANAEQLERHLAAAAGRRAEAERLEQRSP
jgi:hypothetical protein